MPTALIADDEPHLAEHLRRELEALWPALEIVGTAANGIEACAMIASESPDLAFLDIRMPGRTGLEVAQGIEGATRVVFVTAYDEFAIEAFDREALDYVLKPVTTARLARTVERLQRALAPAAASAPGDDARLANALRQLLATPSAASVATGTPSLRYIRASVGELTHQIDVDDVLFLHADEKYTGVHTRQAEYLVRTPIADFARELDATQFVQIHRATLVNLRCVAGTRRDESSRLYVRLTGHPRELPVSRAYVHLFKAM